MLVAELYTTLGKPVHCWLFLARCLMSLERCSKVLWDTCVQLCVFKASCLLHLQCRVFQNEKATLAQTVIICQASVLQSSLFLMSITGRKVTHFNQLKTNCQLVSPSFRAKLPYSHSLHDKSEAEVLAAKLSKAKKPLEKIHTSCPATFAPLLYSVEDLKKASAPLHSCLILSQEFKLPESQFPQLQNGYHSVFRVWVLCLTHVIHSGFSVTRMWWTTWYGPSLLAHPAVFPFLPFSPFSWALFAFPSWLGRWSNWIAQGASGQLAWVTSHQAAASGLLSRGTNLHSCWKVCQIAAAVPAGGSDKQAGDTVRFT